MSEPEKDKREARNFRLPGKTISGIKELADFFSDSQADIIVRAINFLNDNRELAIKQEADRRIKQIK